MMKWLPFSIAALAAVGATAAPAHPRLLSASPAAGASVARPARIELHFSEKLVAAMTGSDLTLVHSTAGTTHAVPIASATLVGADGKTIVVTPKAPLAPGAYLLKWHAVSIDTHRVTGMHGFNVR